MNSIALRRIAKPLYRPAIFKVRDYLMTVVMDSSGNMVQRFLVAIEIGGHARLPCSCGFSGGKSPVLRYFASGWNFCGPQGFFSARWRFSRGQPPRASPHSRRAPPARAWSTRSSRRTPVSSTSTGPPVAYPSTLPGYSPSERALRKELDPWKRFRGLG